MNDTTDIRPCHRCGGEGHIRKYYSINVHCDFCKSYSHHTSVCRLYANLVRAHPMASRRRTSPVHTSRQAEWVQPTAETERADTIRQQKCDETISESDSIRRRDISEITRKHLERWWDIFFFSCPLTGRDESPPLPACHFKVFLNGYAEEVSVVVGGGCDQGIAYDQVMD